MILGKPPVLSVPPSSLSGWLGVLGHLTCPKPSLGWLQQLADQSFIIHEATVPEKGSHSRYRQAAAVQQGGMEDLKTGSGWAPGELANVGQNQGEKP